MSYHGPHASHVLASIRVAAMNVRRLTGATLREAVVKLPSKQSNIRYGTFIKAARRRHAGPRQGAVAKLSARVSTVRDLTPGLGENV
jgi:hypothetical protein